MSDLANFVDLENDNEVSSPKNSHSFVLGLTLAEKLSCLDEEAEICGDVVVQLCRLRRKEDGFWLTPNTDLPTQVNGDFVTLPILLSQGSIIHIGDRQIKFSLLNMGHRHTDRLPGNHTRHGFGSPPPKPSRLQPGDFLSTLSVDPSSAGKATPPEMDQDILDQTDSPFKVAEIAASITLHQIFLYTDVSLSSSEVDTIFRSFKEVTRWDPTCLRAFIARYKEHTERTNRKTDVSTIDNVSPSIHHATVIQLLTDLLHVTMEPVSYNVLWLKILSMFSHFPDNVPVFVENKSAPIVLGCMAAHSKEPAVQQHGCEILSQLALYKPVLKEKGPVRESAVELVIQALKFHSSDLMVLRSGCRAIANLSTSYTNLMTQLLSSVEYTRDADLEEPLSKAISVLDYIGDTAFPVVRDIAKHYDTDQTIHIECQRLLALFSEETPILMKPQIIETKTENENMKKSILLKTPGKKTVHFDETAKYYIESSDDEGSSICSTSSLESDITPETLGVTRKCPCTRKSDSDSGDEGISKEENELQYLQSVRYDDVKEEVKSHENQQNQVGQNSNGFSFLPTAGEIGILGRGRRSSAARKAGIKGATRRTKPTVDNRSASPGINESHCLSEQDAFKSEEQNLGSLLKPNISLNQEIGKVPNCESEELESSTELSELSRSIEAMTPPTSMSSKAKGIYIKARINQYIKKMKDSTTKTKSTYEEIADTKYGAHQKEKKQNYNSKKSDMIFTQEHSEVEAGNNTTLIKRGNSISINDHEKSELVHSSCLLQEAPGYSQKDAETTVNLQRTDGGSTASSETGNFDTIDLQEETGVRKNKANWKKVMEQLNRDINIEYHQHIDDSDASDNKTMDTNHHTLDNPTSSPELMQLLQSPHKEDKRSNYEGSTPGDNIIRYDRNADYILHSSTTEKVITTHGGDDNNSNFGSKDNLDNWPEIPGTEPNSTSVSCKRSASFDRYLSKGENINPPCEEQSLHFVVGVEEIVVDGTSTHSAVTAKSDLRTPNNVGNRKQNDGVNGSDCIECFTKDITDMAAHDTSTPSRHVTRTVHKLTGESEEQGISSEKTTSIIKKDSEVEDSFSNQNRYVPNPDIHNLRTDHVFLMGKIVNRFTILKNAHFLFTEEGDNLITLHQMEFIMKYAISLSDAQLEEESDYLLHKEDPALGLDVLTLLVSRNLSTECFLKVMQQTVEFLEILQHPSLIGSFCDILKTIIRGPMAASIEGGLGFFTLRRLHKMIKALVGSDEIRTSEDKIQHSISELYNTLENVLIWK